MLSRLLPTGIAAVALAASAPALAGPAPLPPKKPDLGAQQVGMELRTDTAMTASAMDPGSPDPAKAEPASEATDPARAPAPAPASPVPAMSAMKLAVPLPPRKPRLAAMQLASADPDAVVGPAPAAPSPLAEGASIPASQAPVNPLQALFGGPAPQANAVTAMVGRGDLNALIAHHARLNNVPESLVHRIVIRESRYNPRAVGRGGAMGLMQIKTATARGVGYQGGPGGLLDAETNLTYGVKYLAGAWRVSGGSQDRAVMHYARGYYYEARRMGLHGASRWSRRGRGHEASPAVAAAPAQTPTLFSFFNQ